MVNEKNRELSRRELSRRAFVRQTGLAAGGLLLAGSAAEALEPGSSQWISVGLPRCLLGKTGVTITKMTLGTAPSGFAKPHSPKLVADCVNTAVDLGVNAIDTAPAYDVGEEGVGLGLGRRRKEIFLSTKVLADDIPTAEKILANSLKVLKTDYVDLVYFHQVGDRKVDMALEPDGVFAWMVKQKKAGKIRFVGISGHNRPAKFNGLLESGECDVLLTVVNFVDRFTYHFDEKVLPVARKHNVGIVAMKVFGGAKKMQYADPKSGPQLAVEHLELAVRHALQVPGVATLNLGAANPDQVRKDVAMVLNAKPLTAEERAETERLGRALAAEWGPHYGPLVRTDAEICPVA